MIASNNKIFDLDRLVSSAVVLLGHVLLGGALFAVVHSRPVPAPVSELIVMLQTETVPKPAAPLPLPAVMPKLITPAQAQWPAEPRPDSIVSAPVQPATTPEAASPAPAPALVPEPLTQRVPVGEDSLPVVDASAAGNPKPAYPKASRALGEQGKVLLDVYIEDDGRVGNIRLHQSSGFARLDEAALLAVRQWRFTPARRAGRAVAMWTVQPISFDLHRR